MFAMLLANDVEFRFQGFHARGGCIKCLNAHRNLCEKEVKCKLGLQDTTDERAGHAVVVLYHSCVRFERPRGLDHRQHLTGWIGTRQLQVSLPNMTLAGCNRIGIGQRSEFVAAHFDEIAERLRLHHANHFGRAALSNHSVHRYRPGYIRLQNDGGTTLVEYRTFACSV